jgi:hypothetical protein
VIPIRCNQPEPIDFNSPVINYLTVRDIAVVPYFKDVIVASDFWHGLLFWKLNMGKCRNKDSFNEAFDCFIPQPLYKVRFEKLGALYVYPEDTPGGEKILFASQLTPPRVIEILIDENMERPPQVIRIYALLPDQKATDFHTLDLIDASHEFILTYLINIKTMVPLIRIY